MFAGRDEPASSFHGRPVPRSRHHGPKLPNGSSTTWQILLSRDVTHSNHASEDAVRALHGAERPLNTFTLPVDSPPRTGARGRAEPASGRSRPARWAGARCVARFGSVLLAGGAG